MFIKIIKRRINKYVFGLTKLGIFLVSSVESRKSAKGGAAGGNGLDA